MKGRFEPGQTVYEVYDGFSGVSISELSITAIRTTQTDDSICREYSDNGKDFTSSDELYSNIAEAGKVFIQKLEVRFKKAKKDFVEAEKKLAIAKVLYEK